MLDRVDDELLPFLKSYSGLKTLRLTWTNDSTSNQHAHGFFCDVLPHHTKSLEILDIQDHLDGPWCFQPEMQKADGIDASNKVFCFRTGGERRIDGKSHEYIRVMHL
jgi:hypothetical protein